MADRDLVARLLRREPDALGTLYDQYADRLYTYAVSQLGGDRDAASDAVTDCFLLAYERIGQLRDPERLRPWLYAITRSECLRRHRAAARLVTFDEGHDMTAPDTDPSAGIERRDAQQLVASSLATLNDPDREVLELALRHDLDAAAVGAVMGLSATHVGARLSRARKQFHKAVLCTLYVRTRGRDCPELAQIVEASAAAEPRLTRKRVTRHIDSCDACERQKPAMIAAVPSLAILPVVAAPATLRDAVMAGVRPASTGMPADPALAVTGGATGAATSAAARLSARRPAYGAGGFPLGAPSRRWWLAAAVAVLALLTTGAVALGLAGRDTDAPLAEPPAPPAGVPAPTPSSLPPTVTPTPSATAKTQDPPASKGGDGDKTAVPAPAAATGAQPETPVGAPPAAPVVADDPVGTLGSPSGGDARKGTSSGKKGVSTPKPSPAPTKTPKPTPTPRPTPTRSPSPSPTPDPLPSITWTATDLAAGTCPVAFDLKVDAAVSGGSLVAASARWVDQTTAASGTSPLTGSGSSWSAVVAGVPTQTQVLMTVSGTAPDGRTVTTPAQEVSHICPG